MKEVFDILRSIEATSSRNEKMTILNNNKDNEVLKKVFEYTYNPYKIYGIGSKTFKKTESESEFASIFDLLDYLMIHNTGSDIDKDKVNAFIQAHIEDSVWYYKILLKDLKIGMTATTINKVWPALIPVFDVMLAEPFNRFFTTVGIEYKIDGCRCVAIGGDKITLSTRNGKPIQGFTAIEEELKELMGNRRIVLDGEIVGTDYKDTMNKLFTETENKSATYMIFDIIPLDAFQKGICEHTYLERKEMLVDLFNERNFANLTIVHSMAVLREPTVGDLVTLMNDAIAKGYEGIMIKDASSPYVCKRSYFWQKLKPFQTAEFTIVGFEEGEGRLTGKLGKVIVDVNGVCVGVGSGFTDEERISIWRNRERYLGTLIEVQYSRVLEDSGSLLFPTVKGFRYDIT